MLSSSVPPAAAAQAAQAGAGAWDGAHGARALQEGAAPSKFGQGISSSCPDSSSPDLTPLCATPAIMRQQGASRVQHCSPAGRAHP